LNFYGSVCEGARGCASWKAPPCHTQEQDTTSLSGGLCAFHDLRAVASLAWAQIEDIVTTTSDQVIGTGSSIERIIIRATIKKIIAATAIEDIVTIFAEKRVIAFPAVEAVVTVAAMNFIISVIAEDPVSTSLTVNIVASKTHVFGATFTVNIVVAISPKDAVRFILRSRN